MNDYKCGGKMNNGGYIPSYAYGGYAGMPQYGLGSWMKKNSKALMGGLMVAGGTALSFTGVGAGVGIPLAAAGAGQIASGISENQQMEAQEEQMAQQTQFQTDQANANQLAMTQQQDMANRQNLINTRMQGMQQSQAPQYGTSFAANGGFLKSYGNGGSFKPNYLNPQPYKTKGGDDYYVMNYNEAFANDPNVKDFAEGYSYTNDPKYAYKYGSINPRYDLKKGSVNFPATYSGDSSMFMKAFQDGLSSDELKSIPQSNPRKLAKGGFMEGVDKNPDVTYFANGGTHEESPLGGIPIGQKGRVEEGEVKANLKDGEYIFSNRF